MFDWTSFGTGFAKAGSEKLDKDEEDAKALGAAQVKSLYENYASVVKENRTLSNDIREKINVIKGFAPNATDDQLVALAQDRGVLDMLSTRLKEKDFDATGFNINNFVTVKKASDSGLSAEERINQLFTIPSAVDSASKAFTSLTPEPAKQGFLSLITGSREGQTRAAAEQTALALGVPLEKLQGAMGYKRDIKPSGAEYNLSLLKNKKGFAEVKDATQLEMFEAKNLYDKDPKNPVALEKLKNATAQVATLVAIEGVGKAQAKKTEEDIRTELVNKIQDPETSPEDKKAAQLELEQRQKLLSKEIGEAAILTSLVNTIQDPKTSPEDKEKARLALDERQKLLSKGDSSEAAIQTSLVNIIQDPKTTPEDKKKAKLDLDERRNLLSKQDGEAAILTDLVNKILDPATPKAEAENFKRQLDARQKLLAKDVPADKVTQANYITIASRAISSAVTEALPPGSLTTIVNIDGTVQMMPSDLVKGPRFTSAIEAAKAGLTKQFTKNGIPLSEFHKNALISVNIMPDAQGRFVAAPAAAETPEPAAPAPAVVAPLVPRPAAPAAAAPAAAAPAAAAPAAAAAKPLRPAGVKFNAREEALVAEGERVLAKGAPLADVKKRLKDNGVTGF